GLYDVPVVGGHLTLYDGPPSISAFGLGRAGPILSVGNAAPGQRLLLACVTEGSMRADFPLFRSFEDRGSQLARDGATPADVAAGGRAAVVVDLALTPVTGLARSRLSGRG